MKKTVFITGSSSGIGRTVANVFARHGWNVAATTRRPELNQLPSVKLYALDVTRPEAVKPP